MQHMRLLNFVHFDRVKFIIALIVVDVSDLLQLVVHDHALTHVLVVIVIDQHVPVIAFLCSFVSAEPS
jgi:hypothetical protein